MKENKKRILYMVTVPFSAHIFFPGQLQFLRENGYEVHLAAAPSPEEELRRIASQEGIEAHFVPLEREIALKRDLLGLFSTWQLMRQLRPNIVNLGTPKAGLIGGLAAAVSGVPIRIYTLHGLRLETARGPKRYILLWMERLACACAHQVICVSPSLRKRAIQLHLLPAHKAIVLKQGSCNGIDAQKFSLPDSKREIIQLREKLKIPEAAQVVGFVGRLVRDKGITELVSAFEQLYSKDSKLYLLLLGDYEEGDPVSFGVRDIVRTHPNIITTGFVQDTSLYYQLMDVLAFPTYREGFGNVALEAGATGVPVVASNATGAIDAVIDGVSGLTVPVKNTNALSAALNHILQNKHLAHQLGEGGRQRVLQDFRALDMWQALDSLYTNQIDKTMHDRKKMKRLKSFWSIGAIIILCFYYVKYSNPNSSSIKV